MSGLALPLFWTAAGVLLLFLGGEGLIRGSSGLALRLGISPLVVGLTVVAFGTSSPELAVSLRAAWAGQGDIAAGNVVGSNIANIGLILGLAALLKPVRAAARAVRADAPLQAAAGLLLAAVLLDGRVSRGEGLVLLSGIVAYTASALAFARREGPEVVREYHEGLPASRGSLWVLGPLAAGGLGLLLLGARFFLAGSVELARRAGVSEAVLGLTLVAVGTSLPELVTSVLAALRGEPDIALGNVLGSNLFNILGILGAAAAAAPLEVPGIGPGDLLAVAGFGLLVVPVVFTGRSVSRAEGAGLLLLYLAYLAVRTLG
ncbi:MAG: calcium/sodium antiporter [Acidobacteriota bacterium]